MQTLPLPRLAHTGLAAPTGDDFRDAVRAVTPAAAFDGIWTEVCEAADLPLWATLLDIPALERLAAAMSKQAGAVGVAGRAMEVRVSAYKALSAMPNAQEWQPRDWSQKSVETLVRSRVIDVDRMEIVADLNPFTDDAKYRASEIARTIQSRFGANVAYVSMLIDGAQYFIGKAGIDGPLGDTLSGAPLEWALCSRMVRTGEGFQIANMAEDVLHKYNPVAELLGNSSYLGVPMVVEGQVVGSVCIFGKAPRTFSAQEISELENFAKAAVSELQADRDIRI